MNHIIPFPFFLSLISIITRFSCHPPFLFLSPSSLPGCLSVGVASNITTRNKVTHRWYKQHTHTMYSRYTHRAAGARSNMLRFGAVLQDAGLCRVKESGAKIKVWWWAENDFLASSEILRPTALLFPHLTRSLMLSATPRGMEREGAIEKYSRVCVCVNE